jgi:hypothetical protein
MACSGLAVGPCAGGCPPQGSPQRCCDSGCRHLRPDCSHWRAWVAPLRCQVVSDDTCAKLKGDTDDQDGLSRCEWWRRPVCP